MKRKTRKFVERHHLRDKTGSPETYSELVRFGPDGNNAEIKTHEDIRANPDGLIEGEQLWGDNEVTNPQRIMGEAIAHLQGRQCEVYLLTMRDGKSLAEAAEILGISKAAAQSFRDRAVKFITAYCHNAIARGKV